MATDKQTNKQTDAPSSNSYLDIDTCYVRRAHIAIVFNVGK